MKKVLLCLGALLMLTGCGGKKLECSKTETESGIELTAKVVMTFKKDEITKIKAHAGVVIPEDKKEYLEFMEKGLNESKADYEKEYGATVKIEKSDLKLTEIIDIDVTKLTDDKKDDLQADGLYHKGNYEEAKKAFEDADYTCK